MTEEQLEDIFKTAGPIQSTKLMFDKVTGKSKGFAFIQYYDSKSASSAIRNLDNHKVGNLRLKVNYSSGSFQSSNNDTSSGNDDENSGKDAGAIPDIVNAVSSLTAQYKVELLAELKQMIINKPENASLLLSSNPQLSYAVVQSLFELGLVDAKFLVVSGDNFGCGSSREHAPWALADFGIRSIIAPSFGDIFYNNSLKNGLLPIRISAQEINEKLIPLSEKAIPFCIDLEKQQIVSESNEVIIDHFDIDPFRKHCLINGLDDIGITLQKENEISVYEKKRHSVHSFLESGTKKLGKMVVHPAYTDLNTASKDW
ncbi:hypothetical protein FF38_08346 [Lucilia cuprina]|uniref:3-isopropylmalate dehydratase n=1 Tax=Lucilia cuprina TaxID=7375 RepID=A0A0L0CPX0_LUCCU|nr:hypothetical protein FF38_08346 [Lucilia cuprina]